MSRLLALLCVAVALVLLLTALCPAQSTLAPEPALAVVRIKSHGASATVIATEPGRSGAPGRSWILGCCHQFFARNSERVDQQLLTKPLKLDGPQQPYAPARLSQARVIAFDSRRDLSLLEVDNGPWYYLPVAPPGYRPSQQLLTAGYDEMKWPVTTRPATILKVEGQTTWTVQPPWHGRSGGGLLDAEGRYLVGVVQAYTGQPSRPDKGLHASHASVLAFMAPHWPRCPADGRQGVSVEMIPPVQTPAPSRRTYIDIAPAHRVPNRTGSQCVWASLETLCRHHGITAGYDLTASYSSSTAGPADVARALDRRGIRYRQQGPGQQQSGLVRAAGEAGLGCMVGLSGRHAVVCCGMDGDSAIILDNMGPHAGQVVSWPRERFQPSYDGWCVVVYPPGAADAPAPQARPAPLQPRLSPFGQQCPGGT